MQALGTELHYYLYNRINLDYYVYFFIFLVLIQVIEIKNIISLCAPKIEP